jgi:hypothetical protein
MKIFSPILKGTTTVAQGTTNLSGSFTGSLFGTAATASYADNFTVGGTLTAQTINVQIITSSIEFNTGSTRNGALSTNTHQFTGSVLMSGSLTVGSSVAANQFISNATNVGDEYYFFRGNSAVSNNFTAYAYSNTVYLNAYSSIYLRANNTGGSGGSIILNGGNVGIGTTTPSGGISGNELALHLAHSNVSILALQSTAASGKKWQIYSSNDGGLYFRDGTAGTQVVSFSSNGSVGIGTTSPDTNLTVYGANVSTANASANANVYTTTGYGVDVGGSIGLGGYYNATNNITYANLHGKKENATLNDSNGYFAVSVRSGTDGTVERMRISSNGNVGIGTTGAGRRLSVASAAATQTLFVHNQRNISGDYGLTMQLGGNTNNASSYYMFCDTDAVGIRMVVYGNGNVANINNSYGAYSDIKLKENITDATPKLDDLLKVKIRNYNLKTDPSLKQIGIIAQELETIFPGLIEESNDTIKDEETGELINTGTTTKSIKYSVFVPMLIKAIQELSAENDTLKEILQRNNIQ